MHWNQLRASRLGRSHEVAPALPSGLRFDVGVTEGRYGWVYTTNNARDTICRSTNMSNRESCPHDFAGLRLYDRISTMIFPSQD